VGNIVGSLKIKYTLNTKKPPFTRISIPFETLVNNGS
jgi:hypothetical protein